MASSMNTNEDTMEVIKLSNIDLRSFCQDELHLVAYFSSPFFKATFAHIVIPTVDKTLFNPSVGSRKQTYSRRSRGRSRAEQNFSLSLSSQSRAGIQLTVAKQFKDSTAQILANVSTKLLSCSLKSIRKESCVDEPRNVTITDLDYRNDETSGRMVVDSGQRLCVPRGPILDTCVSELLLEKRFSDAFSSGNSNNCSIVTKLVVNSDTKRVEAPLEGEEVSLQLKMQKNFEAGGKFAEAAGSCSETCTAAKPMRKARIKEGGGGLVSEIMRGKGIWREVDAMGHDFSNAAALFMKNKIRGKRLAVSLKIGNPKRLAINLQEKRVEEEEASLILRPLSQRVESKLVDVGKETCGNECTNRQVCGGLKAETDKKDTNEKEAAMLECLSKMEGMWLSNQKAMKVVDAKGFPKGWKVTIRLCTDKNGQVFFEYHNYQSPDGKLWPSFKEASQYLLYEVKKLPMFSGVQSISLICPAQLDQSHAKGGECGTIDETVSKLSDDVVRKGFGKVEQDISKPELSRVDHIEGIGAQSLLKDELLIEKDGRRCSLSVEPQHLVGWNDKGCIFCKMALDHADLCVCNWCENEFHAGCVEAVACVNERSLLCPFCQGE